MRALTFSVVVCNHDYGDFLGAALDSVLAQRFPAEAVELIVVDDGSTDRSREVLETYRRRCARVAAVLQPNLGQAAAFRAGVAAARNAFVCLLDSDDVFAPGKLEAVAARLAAEPSSEPMFLCHDAAVWDQTGSGASARTLFELIGVDARRPRRALSEIDGHFQFSIPAGQVLSRELARRVLDALPAADWRRCADGPIAHAAALTTGIVHYLDAPLCSYRIHGRNAFVRLEAGRFSTKQDWRALWPKQMAFLRSYLRTLDLPAPARAEREGYLARMERLVAEAAR